LLLAACGLWPQTKGAASDQQLIPDPWLRSHDIKYSNTMDQGSVLIPGPCWKKQRSKLPQGQGSVLAMRVFGSLSIYFTPQPEVVPVSYLNK